MVDTMTSWFSVSDALTRVAVMVCVVCVTGGQLGAAQGTLRIPQCSAQGWLDIEEHLIPYIECKGFGVKQTAKWRFVRNNTVTANATCGPDDGHKRLTCNTTSSNIYVDRFNDWSELSFRGDRRELASDGRIDCYVDDNTTTTCRTNVIFMGGMSDCEVTVTTHLTLAGTCNFYQKYSSNGTYTCTWTLTPVDRLDSPDIIIPGDITKTEHLVDGRLYHKGTCSFTIQMPGGHYNYTVRMFPGNPAFPKHGSVNVQAGQCSCTGAYIAIGVLAAVVVIVAVVVLVRRYQGTAQSVYEVPDQESAPGVELSQTKTGSTPDTGN